MEPPFCPNPTCSYHHFDTEPAGEVRFFSRVGSYCTKVVGKVVRYRCNACRSGFSQRTFSLDYYTKKSLDNQEILRAISESESVSAIARHLACSTESVHNRLDRLGRAAIALHAALTANLKLHEDLAADGFESFDRSQFFPNNINLLVGAESQFLYAATHTSLRRKGSMTESQWRCRAVYDTLFRPPSSGLRDSFARLAAQIPSMWDKSIKPTLTLRTDENKSYPAAIQKVPELVSAIESGCFTHETYSSKAPRTVFNPLFSVNYYDRELRKDVAAFHRESTCYTRNTASGLLRFCCHLVRHNYMKDYRVHDGAWKGITHGEYAGIDGKKMRDGLRTMFRDRPFLSKMHLSPEWVNIWMRQHPTPLKRGAEYVPRFAAVGYTQGSGN